MFTSPVLANTVTLTWDGAAHADGYQLEEKLKDASSWTEIPVNNNNY
ncbi:hypothetical protein [Paraglaciecola sp.]